MYEQNTSAQESAVQDRGDRDAIEISDFVYAATGARLRRLTMPDGTHWFPAVDVCKHLGYANTRQALQMHVAADCQKTLSEIAGGVCTADTLRKLAAQRLQKSMRMVNLRGLIQLVNGCTKPECAPFKEWVCEVIATIQRTGSYTLEPAPVQPSPTGGTAYVMPQQVVDAIVRLEERNIRADDAIAVREAERNVLLGEFREGQAAMAAALHRIADSVDRLAERIRPGSRAVADPTMTAQELLATWQAKNLVVTADVHAVAAYLAPALVRGAAQHRLEEIAGRTGLSLERVHDSVRMLLKRGCMKQSGCAADGAPVYVLS